MKLVVISDTHNRHKDLVIPKCDILIHCGDWTSMGYKHEVEAFAKWLNKQPAESIVLIPGNHELQFEKDFPHSRKWLTDHCERAILLVDEAANINGVKIWGSPATPWFCDWAWNRSSNNLTGYHMHGKSFYPRPIKPHWDMIPLDTNILITHGPPYEILDQTTYANGDPKPGYLGCEELANRIKELKDLDLHFFGHIHAPGGQQIHKDGVSYYNAAICDETYFPSNSITIVEYELESPRQS